MIKYKKMVQDVIRLNEMQAIQGEWQNNVLKENAVPATLLDKLQEELEELTSLRNGLTDEEFNLLCQKNSNIRQEVGMEAIDTIIVAVGLIHTLGLDAEALFLEKMQTNHEKYNFARINNLVDQGLSREEALGHAKSKWNKK